MKKNFYQLLIRIVTTIVVGYLILFGINCLLKVKYKVNTTANDSNAWNWQNENEVLKRLLINKYVPNDSTLYPLIQKKDETIKPKAKNEKRILVVGDSFVWGYGGDNINYTWWKQLQLMIKKSGYDNISIYGAGIYAANTREQYELILNNDTLIKTIDPDLIIMGYVSNDVDEFNDEIKNVWEVTAEENWLLRVFPNIYEELKIRYDQMANNNYNLTLMANILGGNRYDLQSLLNSEGKMLENYKQVLQKIDNRLKSLDIPYFYYFTENYDNHILDQSNKNIYNTMKELSINAYYSSFSWYEQVSKLPQDGNYYSLSINPGDSHPGIIVNYDYAQKLYDILQNDYAYLFENAVIKDLEQKNIVINDTTPYLNIKKIKKNIFEIEYPIAETEKTLDTQFLYYPLYKNYIKLNLQFPKKVKKIIINGNNIKNLELYVNTINESYGYDLNSARQYLTPTNKIDETTFEVNEIITSINISAEFLSQDNRTLTIKFIEE